MKNFFVTTILMIISIVAFSQTIDTSNKNRVFTRRLQQSKLYYTNPMPDKFGFGDYQREIQRGLRLPIPDSIYVKNGKVVMLFDEGKIKQFIQNRKRKWMNL